MSRAYAWPDDRGRGRSLYAARVQVEAHLDVGITCPCCGQLARRRRVALDHDLVATLRALVDAFMRCEHADGWVSAQDVAARRPTLALVHPTVHLEQLLYWRLVEQHPTLARWRPTPQGGNFAAGTACVRSHAVVYNGELVCLDGDWVTPDTLAPQPKDRTA